MFRKKCFLDIQNAKIISQSIVLVNNIKILAPQQEINIHNPFANLCNDIVLKMIFEEQICNKNLTTPPFINEYSLGAFTVTNDMTPSPRLAIKKQTNDKSFADITSKVKKLIDTGSLLGKYDNVGVNYEIYFDNSQENINITNVICKQEISKMFSDCSIQLVAKIDSDISLNLSIADAIKDGKKIIYITANFYHLNVGNKSLDNIISSTKFYKVLEDKIKEIKF